jgi:hypothetical protein
LQAFLEPKERLSEKQTWFAAHSRNKDNNGLCREINEFKKGYRPSTCLVKDDTGDLLADSHHILPRWKNYFPHLLNAYKVSVYRLIEIHTAEPLVPDLSLSRLKMVFRG